MSTPETTKVTIIGCGPTGAVLSAYLARQGVKNIVLEREPGITTDPRGIALDEDGIRLLQGLGLYDRIYTEIGKVMGVFNFVPGANDLYRRPFLRFDYNTIEGGTGHVGFICHKQPSLEKCLRSAMHKDYVSLRSNSTVTAISEDKDWVYVEYTDKEGQTCKLRSKFLVGADGKTGFTRKKYLEPKGITMERDPKTRYEEVWVALNWRLTPPTPKSHPDFPLWKLGYTPEEVYDLFFPKEFRFLCNPDRPSVCGRFGLEEDRLWRFEFVVKPDEDNMEMASQEKTREIIMPYLTHRGKRYGLKEDISWPLDCIECVRSRPFSFSARSCNKWALGRTILCGDAAHVFPPFGGQGIASGFRDAVSLSWRLAIACRPSCNFYDDLFTGWYTERKQQLERSLAATIENGNFCTEASKVKAFIRNWYLWFVQLVPSWKHDLEMGARRDGMIKYDYRPGMPFLKELEGGRCMPQVFSAPVNEPAPAMPSFTDDMIFAPEKKKLFQIAVIITSVEEVEAAQADLVEVDKLSSGDISAAEATYILHDSPGPIEQSSLPTKIPYITRVIAGEEYTLATERHPENLIHRPPPLYYNPNRIRDDIGKDKKYIILRPDRFIFAACRDKQELEQAAGSLQQCLMGGSEEVHANGTVDGN